MKTIRFKNDFELPICDVLAKEIAADIGYSYNGLRVVKSYPTGDSIVIDFSEILFIY